MTETVTEVVTESSAAEPEVRIATPAEVIEAFVTGEDSQGETIGTNDGVLYVNSVAVARRNSNGQVLLPNNSLSSVELNDLLVAALARNNVNYLRLAGFNNLTDGNSRLRDLDAGNLTEFAAVANMVGLEYTQAEVDSIAIARDFKARVQKFFTDFNEVERQKRLTAEEKLREERIKGQTLAWDRGEGQAYNYDVKGEGGGQRLRLVRAGTKNRVEASGSGNSTGPKTVERAWNFASRHWHGGKRIGTGYREYESMSLGTYSCQVGKNHVHIGCQQVTRQEAERFAELMGWQRATAA